VILRFYLYSFFKNLRFADPFLVLFFLDRDLSYSAIGLLLGLQHLVAVLLEFPSGVLADRWGRRRVTALCFLFYAAAFCGFGSTGLPAGVALICWLAGCLGLFALGEALRTGSHKAIMLDYLDSSGQSELATRLIGRTRWVSKWTSATAALLGGLVLFWSQEYSVLFFLSAAASLCGFLLMLTYPQYLEGESQRQRVSSDSLPSEQKPLRKMWKRPALLALLLQSILFESQQKIILKYFTQPFLKVGLGELEIPIVATSSMRSATGSGAFGVGVSEFFRDSLGGLGARFSPHFEAASDNRFTALNRVYLGGLLAVFLLALCKVNLKWGLIPGVIALTGLTILHNLRRPIFVSALNVEMEKSQRASVLSFFFVSRAVAVAVLLPLFGWAADQFGLNAVWILSCLILLCGLTIPLFVNHLPQEEPPSVASAPPVSADPHPPETFSTKGNPTHDVFR